MILLVSIPDQELTDLQISVINGKRQQFIDDVDDYINKCIKFNRSRSHEVSSKVQKNKKKI